MTASQLAMTAGGAALVLLAALDLFLTVFNYDGFTAFAGRFQHLSWRAVLVVTAPLPPATRRAARSLGSTMLLPATVALWLAAEITGFALIYAAGLGSGGFRVTPHLATGIGSGFYLSAGAESSLTFGDVIARNGLYQALVDIQTILGLATFTLALGYVVTTFGVLANLDSLHSTVRRHARHPGRPSSILARHYQGGAPTELTDLLQILSDRLESYEDGLRRYPVVFYFHTRRYERSIPSVFSSLGELLAEMRWGLPPTEGMTHDPWLAALLDQYRTTTERLRHSFVGPEPFEVPPPAARDAFAAAYRSGSGDSDAVAFRSMQDRARNATGLAPAPDADTDGAYARYREWHDFETRRVAILTRVTKSLGYDDGEP